MRGSRETGTAALLLHFMLANFQTLSFESWRKGLQNYSQRILWAEVSALVRERPSSLTSTDSLLQPVFSSLLSAGLDIEGHWTYGKEVRPLSGRQTSWQHLAHSSESIPGDPNRSACRTSPGSTSISPVGDFVELARK